MKLSEILKNVKYLCKIDTDETEFDEVLTVFINDTLSDLYSESKTTTTLKIPVIQGKATVEEGYQIIQVEPTLNVGDRIVGRTIFTTHKGVLDVYVSEEAPVLKKLDDEAELPTHILNLIPYNVASLWYGYKKKTDLSYFWSNKYESEKYKRFDVVKAEETYEIPLPFSHFFN